MCVATRHGGTGVTDVLGILGPGTLGLSLAAWAAEQGLDVRLLGRDAVHAGRGLAEVRRRWEAAVARGRLDPAARAAAQDRLSAASFRREALEGLDILLEAVPEDPGLKAEVLARAASWLGPEGLLLTGTSSLPVSELAARAGLPGRLLGFHLFVPVARMAVVEVAAPEGTPPRFLERALNLASALGKRAVCVRDQAGFAAARMALAQGLEAMRLLEAGVASAEDLDALMTLGYGHPAGPLELSDRVGLDLRLRIADVLHAATGDPRFEAPRLLRDMVARGETGLRTGRGFYTWDASGRRM